MSGCPDLGHGCYLISSCVCRSEDKSAASTGQKNRMIGRRVNRADARLRHSEVPRGIWAEPPKRSVGRGTLCWAAWLAGTRHGRSPRAVASFLQIARILPPRKMIPPYKLCRAVLRLTTVEYIQQRDTDQTSSKEICATGRAIFHCRAARARAGAYPST